MYFDHDFLVTSNSLRNKTFIHSLIMIGLKNHPIETIKTKYEGIKSAFLTVKMVSYQLNY